MALIDRDEAVVAIRDALKPNTTRAIRGMYAIKQLEEVEAIPVEWIEEHIKWLKSLDNAFSGLTAMNIEVMLKKWREEQK